MSKLPRIPPLKALSTVIIANWSLCLLLDMHADCWLKHEFIVCECAHIGRDEHIAFQLLEIQVLARPIRYAGIIVEREHIQ